MNSGDCPICLYSIGNKNGQVEPCFHVFCLKCIKKWTETSVNCPVCRGRLTSINGSQLETSGMAGLARDAIGQDQVVATQTDRCKECNEPLISFGMLLCSHCGNRLYRCEECTKHILSKDEDFWFCPRCEQWTPCPTPAIGNSTFQIEEPEYALYEFENQEDTYSRDNPSTSFNSSNATITYHRKTNVMDQIVLAMNKERNTPWLITSLSDKKASKSDPERMKRIENEKREYQHPSHRKLMRTRSRAAKERSRAKDESSERSSRPGCSRRFRAQNNGRSMDDTRPG